MIKIKIKIILIGILLGYTTSLLAHDDKNDAIPVRQLVLEYAEFSGTNFVVSSKVRGDVNLLGFSVEELSEQKFVDILENHHFITTRKDGVVHVFTRFEVEFLGKGLGPIWRG